MDITDKNRIRNLFFKITLFISLYENFLQTYKDSVLAFYTNGVSFENGEASYQFSDSSTRSEYEKAVHRTCRKNDGNWDHDLSLFNWLKNNGIITDEHFEQLKEIRLLRNKLVHNLDSFLGSEFPEDFEEKLEQIIKIRKHATKWWYLQIEYPTNPEENLPFDIGEANLDEVTVLGNSDIFYDLIRSIIEE